MFTQEFWDAEVRRPRPRSGRGRPNPRLVEHAADLPPGVAVDVGCGEGADVVWLAERGWRVTGVDVSVVALEKAERHAGEAGVADRTSWLHADLVAGDALPGGADLVSAQYLHVPDAAFDSGVHRHRGGGPARRHACSWSATTPPTGTPGCATRS